MENQYISDICRLCERLISSDSMDVLLQSLVDECASVLKVKASSVRLLDEKHQSLLVGAAHGLSEKYLKKGPVDLEKSTLDKEVILSGKDVEIENVATDSRIMYPKEMAEEGISSALCMPLKVRGKAIGVLRLYTAERHDFTAEEKRVAKTLACQGGVAIERARIYREMETMIEISRKVSSTLDVAEILDSVVKSAAETLGFKAASIRLFDEEQKTLEVKAAYGLSDRYLGKGPIEVEKSPIDKEILACSPVQVMDIDKDKLPYPEEVRREGIKTTLCLPMSIKGKVIGVLRVYTSVSYEFDKREVDFLSALANQAAIAIENARLFEHLKRDYDDLTKDVWNWYSWGVREPSI